MAAQLISSVPQSARAPLHPRCTPHRREHPPPRSTAANDGPPNPRMGPISGQTLARQAGPAQAWQRYPHPLPVFGSQTWFVPLFPRACNLSRAALSMSTVQASLVFSALSPDPNLPHRRCSPVPVFAVSLLPRPSSSSTKLESLGCASLSFFENTAPTSLVPFFTSSALLYALPLSTVTDSSSSIDARPSTPPPRPRPSSFFPASNTHTHARFVLLFARLLRRTSSPRPDDTHPRVANLLPSSDPVSVGGPPQHRSPHHASAQRHQHRARPHFCFSTSKFSTCFRQKSARRTAVESQPSYA